MHLKHWQATAVHPSVAGPSPTWSRTAHPPLANAGGCDWTMIATLLGDTRTRWVVEGKCGPWPLESGRRGGWIAVMENIGNVIANTHSLEKGRLALTSCDGEA